MGTDSGPGSDILVVCKRGGGCGWVGVVDVAAEKKCARLNLDVTRARL